MILGEQLWTIVTTHSCKDSISSVSDAVDKIHLRHLMDSKSFLGRGKVKNENHPYSLFLMTFVLCPLFDDHEIRSWPDSWWPPCLTWPMENLGRAYPASTLQARVGLLFRVIFRTSSNKTIIQLVRTYYRWTQWCQEGITSLVKPTKEVHNDLQKHSYI
jgi:hypothetical protein